MTPRRLPARAAGRTRALAAAFAWTCSLAGGAAHAAALRYCDSPAPLTAPQQDKLFRFAALVKAELEGSGQGLALISRSGLALDRFGVRYSHAGLSLKASENAPWSVRQLYYACDEGKPRLYDQGISGFLAGTDDPALAYISLVFLPSPVATTVERAALDKRQALQLLGATYSANAYPFSLRYQNCNQWVMELLAVAWGDLGAAGPPLRVQAQRWLQDSGYRPSDIDVGHRALMWAGAFVPWLHSDDHPPEDLAQLRYRVSMPASIEGFVKDAAPGARRVEFCHTGRYAVIRRGWDPIAEGCQPAATDQVVMLD